MTNLSDTERKAITGLIAVARAAFTVADDAEDDGAAYQIKVLRTHADALGAALDTLDELPDDQPGYSMGPSNKAEWALRRMLSLASAPVSFDRHQLRALVDVVWNEATESTAVPDTPWADRMIDKVFS